MTIYVASTPNLATGGPELLQQLVHGLRRAGLDARIYFAEEENPGPSPVPKEYLAYGNPFVTKIVPGRDDVLIVPETRTHLLYAHPELSGVIWWLSVDNYTGLLSMPGTSRLRRFLRSVRWALMRRRRPFLFTRDRHLPFLHFYQSDYARTFLVRNGIAEHRLFSLGDYLNEEFIGHDFSDEPTREDVILYNPKKGAAFTQRLIDAAPDLIFEPLIGLSRAEMISRLQRCKLYIDFGHHPGKDRIPREAAALGCCVLTNRQGSAGHEKDVPIPDAFKIDDHAMDMAGVLDRIREILSDFTAQRQRFATYREAIAAEPQDFQRQLAHVVTLLQAI